MGRIGKLIDTVIDRKNIARLLLKSNGRLNDSLAVNTQFDRADGAHGGAASAKGAFLFSPDDLPGKIACAQSRWAYLSH
jgi:hypothetical protein